MIANFHTALRPSTFFYEYKNLMIDHYDDKFDEIGAEYQLRVFPQSEKNFFFVVLFNPNNASTYISDIFNEFNKSNTHIASKHIKTNSSQKIMRDMDFYMSNNEMFCYNNYEVCSVSLVKNLWLHKNRTLDEWKEKIDKFVNEVYVQKPVQQKIYWTSYK